MTGGPGQGSDAWTRIPVDPDAPEAQQWLREELAKAPYQAARPTWFDRLSQGFLDWLGSLTAPAGEGLGPWLPLVLTVLVAAVLVTALLVFGVPRLNRRSRLADDVFGDDDRRTAEALRRSAEAAAASGQWNRACEEMFRAMARGLVERTILTATPGTTAHHVAELAGNVFPGERDRLVAAAAVFDGVRYLGRAGNEAGYAAIADLERDLRTARPSSLPAPLTGSQS